MQYRWQEIMDNEILSGYHLVKNDNSGTIFVPIITIWYDYGSKPFHLYTNPHPVTETEQTNGGRGLVGGVMSLLGFILSPDWYIFVLLEHICQQVPGLTDTENSVKFLGLCLISITSFIKWSMYPVAISSMEVLLKLKVCPVSDLCSVKVDFSGWSKGASCVPYTWS
jgi:hypothetical protein